MEIVQNDILKEPIGRILDKIGKLYQANLRADLSHLDIDRSFYPLLLIESRNGMTQQELARELSCDKVQVVRIIDYLSNHNYVQRIQKQTDKRKYELTITEKSGLLIPEIRKVIDNMSAVAFKGLSEKQIDELYRILSILEINLLSK
ncbi:MAG: MarR family transcriptional regulator [Paludibacter sp.]|jgi:DNA-binding MarR family transcriptional regulator